MKVIGRKKNKHMYSKGEVNSVEVVILNGVGRQLLHRLVGLYVLTENHV